MISNHVHRVCAWFPKPGSPRQVGCNAIFGHSVYWYLLLRSVSHGKPLTCVLHLQQVQHTDKPLLYNSKAQDCNPKRLQVFLVSVFTVGNSHCCLLVGVRHMNHDRPVCFISFQLGRALVFWLPLLALKASCVATLPCSFVSGAAG